MCHGHWMLIPEPLQKMITRLYNNDMPLSGYQDACLNAVQQVQDKVSAGAEPRTFFNPAAAWPFPPDKRKL